MLNGFGAPVDALLWLISVGALAYLLVALYAVSTLRLRRSSKSNAPSVCVLKPLCGDEPRLYDALRSFVTQDYPGPIRFIFGAQRAGDPALEVVRRLQREHPERRLEVVVDETIHGPNLKVSNLINMSCGVDEDLLVVSDSDALIRPGALKRVLQSLEPEHVGVATCFFTGTAHDAACPVARLGALYINAWFLPAAVTHERLFSAQVCFGPLTAIKRLVLEGAGGFEALSNCVADDTELGPLARRQGKGVAIAPELVSTVVPESRLPDLLEHELRWAKTMRAQQPAAYVGSLFMHGSAANLLLAILQPEWPVWLCLGLNLALRWLVLRSLSAKFGSAGLIENASPVSLLARDLLCFLVWSAGLFGNSITWRGRRLRIARRAKLFGAPLLDDGVFGELG